jgi:hypothetical protein
MPYTHTITECAVILGVSRNTIRFLLKCYPNRDLYKIDLQELIRAIKETTLNPIQKKAFIIKRRQKPPASVITQKGINTPLTYEGVTAKPAKKEKIPGDHPRTPRKSSADIRPLKTPKA